MFKYSKLAAILAVGLMGLMWGAPAQAQATRTWISGVGDDVNPCSRTAPCKTFPGAISKTAAGGEIDCLDPGGFGSVTIVKSITLDCGGGIGGQAGSILASGTNGITVNDSTQQALVKIRNMSINGIQKSGSAGLSGIKFIAGSALIVEHVGIFGFGGTPGNNGGIDFEPNAAARLYTLDVEIQYGLGDGILVKPAAGGNALAVLSRTSTLHNAGAGLRVDNSYVTSGSGANVVATESTFAGNAQFGVFAVSINTPPVKVMLYDDTIAANLSAGVVSNGAVTTVRLGHSVVSANGTGIVATNSAALLSYGNNQVDGNNVADAGAGTPTGSVALR